MLDSIPNNTPVTTPMSVCILPLLGMELFLLRVAMVALLSQFDYMIVFL